MPDKDVDERELEWPPAFPDPPPPGYVPSSIPGYESIVGTDDSVIPAPPQSRDPPPPTSRPTIPTVNAVSNDEARGALLDLVGQNFCWGKGPAKELEFT